MQKISVKHLYIYPVKSLAGVSVPSIQFNALGPVDDRRYMLVDQNNRFITQRSHALLSQFKLTKVDAGWQVAAPNGDTIVIDPNDSTECSLVTKVWKTEIQVREKSKIVSKWFSNHLDELVRLVEFDDLETRYKDVHGHRAAFAFADGYPLLICNEQSLDQLSHQVSYPLDMLRFRPNVVISVEPEAEYKMTALTSVNNEGSIQIASPCVRCNVPAIDPATSVYQKEIHKKMKQVLLRENKVVFGVNAAALNISELSVNDSFNVENG